MVLCQQLGDCVSPNHNSYVMKSNTSSGSNREPDNHIVNHPSPIKEKPPIINGNATVKPQWSPPHSIVNYRDFGGSKEETFYDSQAWLESDCEDEFMSVNGEFTPSRGNTPVHHKFRATTAPITGGAGAPTVEDQEPSSTSPSGTPPSPSKKKKRLSDLFKESQRDTREGSAEPDRENGVVNRSLDRTVVRGRSKPKRERLVETVHIQSCLPRMLSGCRPVNPQQAKVGRK